MATCDLCNGPIEEGTEWKDPSICEECFENDPEVREILEDEALSKDEKRMKLRMLIAQRRSSR